MRKIKILIIEDEVIVAKDIAYYLTELGCEIMGILVEGEYVMPFLKNEKPDIVLMDISLKGEQNGIQTVHLIKEQYDIPVIYLTANTDDRSFELAKATKPFGFVEKPFKPKRLVRTVQLLVEQIAEKKEDENVNDDAQFILNDRIFVRENGKFVTSGSSLALRNDEDVKEFYLGIKMEEAVRGERRYKRKRRWG